MSNFWKYTGELLLKLISEKQNEVLLNGFNFVAVFWRKNGKFLI